ncbi:hypothetical protein [uncultured Alteromonas sp.]|uniref:hypothetical protein n=1 Tax=uncultured Alteromonas sp. TaxID=179113 RepID=UPI00258EA485|nr:hypothetical protein [uncultured Alteromonas sp.]
MSKQSNVKHTQDEFLLNQFNEMSENPEYWHNKAAELFTSAGVIWKAMNSGKDFYGKCDATYKMLMGMSFEALLKGLCIESRKVTTADLISHDLVKISKIIELPLNKGENKILMLLSDYIKWAGKYPIPKNSGQLQQYRTMVASTEFDKVNISGSNASISNNALDYEELTPLWRRLSDKLLKTPT